MRSVQDNLHHILWCKMRSVHFYILVLLFPLGMLGVFMPCLDLIRYMWKFGVGSIFLAACMNTELQCNLVAASPSLDYPLED